MRLRNLQSNDFIADEICRSHYGGGATDIGVSNVRVVV